MPNNKLLSGMLLVVVCLSGCASALNRHENIQPHLTSTIDCATADQDIARLKKQRSSTSERIANGIASLLPTSIVLNLLIGEFNSRKAIATGEFDQLLYMKISDIQSTCTNLHETPIDH